MSCCCIPGIRALSVLTSAFCLAALLVGTRCSVVVMLVACRHSFCLNNGGHRLAVVGTGCHTTILTWLSYPALALLLLRRVVYIYLFFGPPTF